MAAGPDADVDEDGPATISGAAPTGATTGPASSTTHFKKTCEGRTQGVRRTEEQREGSVGGMRRRDKGKRVPRVE